MTPRPLAERAASGAGATVLVAIALPGVQLYGCLGVPSAATASPLPGTSALARRPWSLPSIASEGVTAFEVVGPAGSESAKTGGRSSSPSISSTMTREKPPIASRKATHASLESNATPTATLSAEPPGMLSSNGTVASSITGLGPAADARRTKTCVEPSGICCVHPDDGGRVRGHGDRRAADERDRRGALGRRLQREAGRAAIETRDADRTGLGVGDICGTAHPHPERRRPGRGGDRLRRRERRRAGGADGPVERAAADPDERDAPSRGVGDRRGRRGRGGRSVDLDARRPGARRLERCEDVRDAADVLEVDDRPAAVLRERDAAE